MDRVSIGRMCAGRVPSRRCRHRKGPKTRQSQTADSAPGVATCVVTLNARYLQPSPRLHLYTQGHYVQT